MMHSLALAAVLPYVLVAPLLPTDAGSAEDVDARASIACACEEADFRGVLDGCPRLTASEPGSSRLWQPHNILKSDLTPEEERFLASYELGNERRLGVAYSVWRAIEYALRRGALPGDGIELLELYHGHLLSAEGMAEWQRLTPLEQLREVRWAIHPVTGLPYETFQAEEWKPFGVLIEKVEGVEGLKLIPYSWREQREGELHTELRPYQTWRIVLYGEERGSVLIDKNIWTESGETLDAAGPCRYRSARQSD